MSKLMTVAKSAVMGGIGFVRKDEVREDHFRDQFRFPFNAIVAGIRNVHGNYEFLSLNGPEPSKDRIEFATLRKGNKRFFLTQGEEDGTALVFAKGPWSTPTSMRLEDFTCPMQGRDASGRCPDCGAPDYCGAHRWENRYPFKGFRELDFISWDANHPTSGMICTDCFNLSSGLNEQIMFLAEPCEVRLPGWGDTDAKLVWDGKNLSRYLIPDKDLGNFVDPLIRGLNEISSKEDIERMSKDGKLIVGFYETDEMAAALKSHMEKMRATLSFNGVRFGFVDPRKINRQTIGLREHISFGCYRNGILQAEVMFHPDITNQRGMLAQVPYNVT